MEVVASLSQGRTAAAQCGLFTYKSVAVIFEPPCIYENTRRYNPQDHNPVILYIWYKVELLMFKEFKRVHHPNLKFKPLQHCELVFLQSVGHCVRINQVTL